MNNFIRDYLVKLYIPRITWTDIIEIVIIAFVIYNVMVWIKNTKAWRKDTLASYQADRGRE